LASAKSLSIDSFLEDFGSATKEQSEAVIDGVVKHFELK
jgi:hypothetical protein